jgi:hypothetical protein
LESRNGKEKSTGRNKYMVFEFITSRKLAVLETHLLVRGGENVFPTWTYKENSETISPMVSWRLALIGKQNSKRQNWGSHTCLNIAPNCVGSILNTTLPPRGY